MRIIEPIFQRYNVMLLINKKNITFDDLQSCGKEYIKNQAPSTQTPTIIIPFGVETIGISLNTFGSEFKTICFPETFKTIRWYLLEYIKIETLVIPDSVETVEYYSHPKITNLQISDKYEHSNYFCLKYGNVETLTIENHGMNKQTSHVGALNILRSLKNQYINLNKTKVVILGVPLTQEEMREAENLFPKTSIANEQKASNRKLSLNDETWLIHDGLLLKYYGTNPNVIIPEGVVKISSEAFISKPIKSIYLPSSIETIDSGALAIKTLKKIETKLGLKRIDEYALAHTKLRSFTFPSKLKDFEPSAFQDTNLEDVSFYSSSINNIEIFKSIFEMSFCNSIKRITVIDDDGNALKFYNEIPKCKLKNISEIRFIGLNLTRNERRQIMKNFQNCHPSKIINVKCQQDEDLFLIDPATIKDEDIKEIIKKINKYLSKFKSRLSNKISNHIRNLLFEYTLSIKNYEPRFLNDDEPNLTLNKTDAQLLKSDLLKRLNFILERLKSYIENSVNNTLQKYLEILKSNQLEPKSKETAENKLKFIKFISQKWQCDVLLKRIKTIIEEENAKQTDVKYFLEYSPFEESNSIEHIDKKIDEIFQQSISLDKILTSLKNRNSGIGLIVENMNRLISRLDNRNKEHFKMLPNNLQQEAIRIVTTYPIEKHVTMLLEEIKKISNKIFKLDFVLLQRTAIKEELAKGIDHIEVSTDFNSSSPITSLLLEIKSLLASDLIKEQKRKEGTIKVIAVLKKWVETLDNWNDDKLSELLTSTNENVPGYSSNNWAEHFDETTIIVLLILRDLSNIKIGLENYIKEKEYTKKLCL